MTFFPFCSILRAPRTGNKQGGTYHERRAKNSRGGNPELNDAALDAVIGGTGPEDEWGQKIESKTWADKGWDLAKKMFGADEDKEQQS